jgi:hypothetical protein
MSIKNDPLYPKYLNYLVEKNLTKGGFELSKISQSKFDDFKTRYEMNPHFQEKCDKLYLKESREEKIDDIVKDDLDLFLEELETNEAKSDDGDVFDF